MNVQYSSSHAVTHSVPLYKLCVSLCSRLGVKILRCLPASSEQHSLLLNHLILAVVTIKNILVSHLLSLTPPQLPLKAISLPARFMCLITRRSGIKKKDST